MTILMMTKIYFVRERKYSYVFKGPILLYFVSFRLKILLFMNSEFEKSKKISASK